MTWHFDYALACDFNRQELKELKRCPHKVSKEKAPKGV